MACPLMPPFLCRGTQSWLVSGSREVLVGGAVLEKLPSHRSPPAIRAPHDPLSSQAIAVVRQRRGNPCPGPRGPRLPSRVARHPCSRDALPAKWPSEVVVAGLVPEIFHHILNTNSGKRSHFPNWQVFFPWEIPRSPPPFLTVWKNTVCFTLFYWIFTH